MLCVSVEQFHNNITTEIDHKVNLAVEQDMSFDYSIEC